MNTEFNKKGFEQQIDNYIDFEGEEQMRMLQSEVNLIIKEKDLMKFKEICSEFNMEELNEDYLALMAEVIRSWKSIN